MVKPNHILKSWVGLFEPIYEGRKTHELRVMDRDYKVGDILLLKEYEPVSCEYTGRTCLVEITFITSDKTESHCAVSPTGLHPATGILSIRKIEQDVVDLVEDEVKVSKKGFSEAYDWMKSFWTVR